MEEFKHNAQLLYEVVSQAGQHMALIRRDPRHKVSGRSFKMSENKFSICFLLLRCVRVSWWTEVQHIERRVRTFRSHQHSAMCITVQRAAGYVCQHVLASVCSCICIMSVDFSVAVCQRCHSNSSCWCWLAFTCICDGCVLVLLRVWQQPNTQTVVTIHTLSRCQTSPTLPSSILLSLLSMRSKR